MDSVIYQVFKITTLRNVTQTTQHILMVRPSFFGYNEETAANNAFQKNDSSLTKKQIAQKAIKEFDCFTKKLKARGVNLVIAQDTKRPVKPDAVFPNNWITTHNSGTLITYPMFAAQRRKERSEEIIKMIRSKYLVKKIIELEAYEKADLFLEGTGSMIFDRPNRIVYACLSPRTSTMVLDKFCEYMDYEAVVFDALDGAGQAIYHSNVMMALGETFVVICLDTIRDAAQKDALIKRFVHTGKAIIEISMEQMMSFAGNMLQVRAKDNEPLLVMSEQAFSSLKKTQIRQLKKHTKIFHAPLPTIETYGGGSARCMMAEIFLEEK